MDAKTNRWLSCDPILGSYLPIIPVNDKAIKHNRNLPGIGGVFNPVNLALYHYAGNNPLKYTDPDGKSVKSALKLISKHRATIKRIAKYFDVNPNAIAAVIFQEKYHGIFADAKNAIAYLKDGGVNDKSPSRRSYGLAEMQLKLVAELLGYDIDTPGMKKKMYNYLESDEASIALIAANIKMNEKILKRKLGPKKAGFAHNMGHERYQDYLNGEQVNDKVPKRSLNYQNAINKALDGVVDPTPDKKK